MSDEDDNNVASEHNRERLVQLQENLENADEMENGSVDVERIKTILSATLDQWEQPVVDVSPNVSDDTLIRHYVSFPQLISILEGGRLWLSSVAQFDDDLEGSLTKKGEILQKVAREVTPKLSIPDLQSTSNPLPRNITPLQLIAAERDHCLVNCWRIGEDANTYKESAVFWNAYIREGVGVAIETRVGKLKRHFTEHVTGNYSNSTDMGGTRAIAGKVAYINYKTDISSHNYPQRLMFKHGGFEDEREYRIVLDTYNLDYPKSLMWDSVPPEPPIGEYMKTDPSALIENAYLSPHAPDYLLECVENLFDRYRGLSGDLVHQSELHTEDPVY